MQRCLVAVFFVLLQITGGGAQTLESISQLEKRLNNLQAQVENLSKSKISQCQICFYAPQTDQCIISAAGWTGTPDGWRTCTSFSSNGFSSLTSPFQDDTDGRPGGCVYKWQIHCLP
jgi:hypothetical protein